MPFCPICGAHHDPNMLCVNRAGEVLKEMGVKKPQKKVKKAFERAVDRLMVKIAFFVLAGFALILLGASLLNRCGVR